MSDRNYHELDKDQKFWLVLWCIAAILFLVVATMLFVNSIIYKVTIARQANPMEYVCALDTPGPSVNPTCVIYWQSKAGK